MSELHDVAVSIVANPLKITKRRGLDRKVIDTALGVYVKACKQFRSVQLLVEAGLTEDAQAVTRNLGETMIALYSSSTTTVPPGIERKQSSFTLSWNKK